YVYMKSFVKQVNFTKYYIYNVFSENVEYTISVIAETREKADEKLDEYIDEHNLNAYYVVFDRIYLTTAQYPTQGVIIE
ncbi:MAG: hypothetical protein ACI4XM_09010, partial [Candidatus Coprovivens sp.]